MVIIAALLLYVFVLPGLLKRFVGLPLIANFDEWNFASPTRLRHGMPFPDWITYTGQFSCGEGSETQQSAVNGRGR